MITFFSFKLQLSGVRTIICISDFGSYMDFVADIAITSGYHLTRPAVVLTWALVAVVSNYSFLSRLFVS